MLYKVSYLDDSQNEHYAILDNFLGIIFLQDRFGFESVKITDFIKK